MSGVRCADPLEAADWMVRVQGVVLGRTEPGRSACVKFFHKISDAEARGDRFPFFIVCSFILGGLMVQYHFTLFLGIMCLLFCGFATREYMFFFGKEKKRMVLA